jgi:hypothetical protein
MLGCVLLAASCSAEVITMNLRCECLTDPAYCPVAAWKGCEFKG